MEFKAQGISVAYMKPLGSLTTEVGGEYTDEDAVFVLRSLDLNEPYRLACPVVKTQEVLELPFKGQPVDKMADVRHAFDTLSRNADLMIMEGGADLADGYALGLRESSIAEITKAKVVVVVRYSQDMAVDDILMAKSIFGESLVGVIINGAPRDVVPVVRDRFPSFLNQNGLQLLGVLPYDKILTAISVRELARLLKGEILCAADKQEELVENFTIGAMNVDTALKYFLRTQNKAVITGGDRADIQLAALQTSTKCLILTGNLYPDAIILGRAAEMGIPVILVRADTMATVETVEKALGHIRISSQKQVDRLDEMIKEDVNISGLRQILGI
jgi:BioD-like phosphotransacetylase family protein